jgi:hypothetical protein
VRRRTFLTFLATALAGLTVSAMSTTSAMMALFGSQAFSPLFDFLVSGFGLPLVLVAAVAGYVSPRRFWLWGLAAVCLRPVVIVLSTYPAVRAGVIGPSDYLGLAVVHAMFLSTLAALCTAGSGAGAGLRLLVGRTWGRTGEPPPGTDRGTGSGPAGPGGTAGGAPEAPGEEPGAEEGFDASVPVRSFARTLRGVLLGPTDFFRGVTLRGNLSDPLVFAVVCILIGGSLSSILDLLLGRGVVSGLDFGEAPAGGVAVVLAVLIATPFLVALSVFVVAGVYHLLVLLFVRGSEAGFEATFKASAYASATSVASWVPVVGPLLSLYGLYLTVVGIRDLHSTTTGRAAAVVLVPTSVALLVLLAFVLSVGGGDLLVRALLRT